MNTVKKQAMGSLDTLSWPGSTGDSKQGELQDSSVDRRVGAQKPVRLLLVDSIPVVLKGIEAAIKATSDVQLVGKTGDHDRVVALVQQVQPTFVLIDILGRTRGSRSMRVQLEVLRKIRRVSPTTRTIVFTNCHPRHLVETVLDQGAAGVWSKFDDIDDLIEQLLTMQQSTQQKILSPAVLEALKSASDSDSDRQAGWLSQITPRERQVLKLVLEGEDSYKIGERLGISPRTVSTHRSRILQKTNARSFFELIGCLQPLEELGH